MKKGNMAKRKTLLLECDCKTHYLQVTYDEDVKCFDVSYYKHGHTDGFGLGHRLRMVWQVLTTGTPYGDDLILSRAEAGKLIKFMEKEMAK